MADKTTIESKHDIRMGDRVRVPGFKEAGTVYATHACGAIDVQFSIRVDRKDVKKVPRLP